MNSVRIPSWAYAPVAFALLTLLMFFDVLFSTQRVVSDAATDLAMQFVPWREFGFSQLRQGNLALWNPHIFAGVPYFAGFQSALLYPPNWLHLFLPVGVAINWIVALHVFLAGYFTCLWCRGRGIGIGGGIVAGVMFMFSGPYFLHLFAGHLPHLAVMVWTPLMLLSLDKLADDGAWRWCLLGIGATAMHILGGHPQYVYYTGIALTLYTAVRLSGSSHRLALGGGFVAIYAGAVLLTAVQLWSGIQAAGEAVRSAGAGYEFASTFALPPAHFITLVVPTFFGRIAGEQYWGAGYLWEMCLFIGIGGLALAALGAVYGARRPTTIAVVMIVLMMLLALGRHTPLYQPMFDFLPKYNSFRGTVKFAYVALLFVSLLAGMGLDQLLRERRVDARFLIALGALAAALVAYAIRIQSAPQAWAEYVQSTMKSAYAAGELFLNVDAANSRVLAALAQHSATVTYLAAGTVALVAVLLWASRFHRYLPWTLLVLVCVEMFAFARPTRATMDVAEAYAVPDAWKESLGSLKADQRALVVNFNNAGMLHGWNNLLGYDPGVLKRYAELFFASQGADPATANQYLPVRRPSRSVFAMLRCAVVCIRPDQAPLKMPATLPPALLVLQWVELKSQPSVVRYLCYDGFDPTNIVVLESTPDVPSQTGGPPAGTVTCTRRDTDTLELDAQVNRPAILVVATNYSTGWRVVPIAAAQSQYHIMPANYTQVGIPLQPGRHRLVLEYSPLAFRVGKWVSLASLVVYVLGVFWLMFGKGQFR